MKVNELMIGDFVFDKAVSDKPIQIKQINEQNVHYNFKNGYMSAGVELLEPIPLTPEILEKNGFTIKKKWAQIGNFGDNPLIMWHFEDGGSLRDFKHELEIHQNDTGKVHVSIPCEYVHQLQHTLRLCGIDKTITL